MLTSRFTWCCHRRVAAPGRAARGCSGAGARALVLALALLTACAPAIKPVDAPLEAMPAPVDEPLWQELAALREGAAAGDWYHLLNTGYEALEWRLRAIDSASREIELQTFLWKSDRVGTLLSERILAAADRGVTVRILIDDAFLAQADPQIRRLARHPSIEYRIYNPVANRAGGTLTRQLANLSAFERIDHRMHNKVLIIDQQVAIVGGRNLADEYFGYHRQRNFRDMEVLAGGEVVARLVEGFYSYWNNPWSIPADQLLGASGEVAEPGTQALQWPLETAELRRDFWRAMALRAVPGRGTLLLDNPPLDPADPRQAPSQLATALLASLERAERDALLVSAYFVPTPRLQQRIVELLQRGIDVRVLTNSLDSNNHVTAQSAYDHHRRTLLLADADLFEMRADARDRQRYMVTPMQESLLGLHAKVLLLDDGTTFIGSANLDPRSLRLNTEMGLLIESRELNAQLRRYLQPDLAPHNAWRVQLDDEGRLRWRSGSELRDSEPAASFVLRLESWLFGLMPIEDEM